MKKRNHANSIVLSALFLAISYILPFVTGQIPNIGAVLCPMHVPVILCGFICGWPWGLAVGFTAPLLRSLTLQLPPVYPTAICMSFELAAYGVSSALIYRFLPKKKVYIYVSLILAMIIGRLIWGIATFLCLGADVSTFGFSAFWAGAVVNAIPGIVLQILVIPILVMISERELQIN